MQFCKGDIVRVKREDSSYWDKTGVIESLTTMMDIGDVALVQLDDESESRPVVLFLDELEVKYGRFLEMGHLELSDKLREIARVNQMVMDKNKELVGTHHPDCFLSHSGCYAAIINDIVTS